MNQLYNSFYASANQILTAIKGSVMPELSEVLSAAKDHSQVALGILSEHSGLVGFVCGAATAFALSRWTWSLSEGVAPNSSIEKKASGVVESGQLKPSEKSCSASTPDARVPQIYLVFCNNGW